MNRTVVAKPALLQVARRVRDRERRAGGNRGGGGHRGAHR